MCDDNEIKLLQREITLLKKTIRALAKINLHTRIGIPTMPEWVFETIDKAKRRYGDLTKI